MFILGASLCLCLPLPSFPGPYDVHAVLTRARFATTHQPLKRNSQTFWKDRLNASSQKESDAEEGWRKAVGCLQLGFAILL